MFKSSNHTHVNIVCTMNCFQDKSKISKYISIIFKMLNLKKMLNYNISPKGFEFGASTLIKIYN